MAAEEENTIRFTPCTRSESSSATVPTTLLRQYSAGSFIDSPTSERAAKWMTASMFQSPSTGSSALTDSWWNSAPGGTASS